MYHAITRVKENDMLSANQLLEVIGHLGPILQDEQAFFQSLASMLICRKVKILLVKF